MAVSSQTLSNLGPGKRQPLIALANGDQFITADKASKATLKTRSTLDGRGGHECSRSGVSTVSSVRDSIRHPSAPFPVPISLSASNKALPSIQVQQPFPPSPPSSPSTSPVDKPLVGVVAPPLTPTSSSDALPTLGGGHKTFLNAVFPTMPVLAATAINVPDERWEMAVVNGETLYARCQGGAYVDLCMRESVVDLLDRASEDLDCTGLVICLDKKEADLAEILHSLMYVGGNIISPKTTAYDNRSFVLVGIDV